jgi:hypothetical protein
MARHFHSTRSGTAQYESFETIARAAHVLHLIGPTKVKDPHRFIESFTSLNVRQGLIASIVDRSSGQTRFLRYEPGSASQDEVFAVPLMLGLLHLDLADWLRRSRETIDAVRRARFSGPEPGIGKYAWYMPLSSGMPVTGAIAWQMTADTQAQINVAIVALRLVIYQREHGLYPDTLDALGDDLPNDPIAESPLGYRKTVRGFVLSSTSYSTPPKMGWNWSGEPWLTFEEFLEGVEP